MLVCCEMDRGVFIAAVLANFLIILAALIVDFNFVLAVTPPSMGQTDAASFGFGLIVPPLFASFAMVLLACYLPHEERVPRTPRPARSFPIDHPLFVQAQGGQSQVQNPSVLPLASRSGDTDGASPKPQENGIGNKLELGGGGFECALCWGNQMNLVAFRCIHVFCAGCRDTLLKGVRACPVCRSPTTTMGDDTREVVALSTANQ